MTTPVETIPAAATVGDARQLFTRAALSAYPLLDDDGQLAGIVSRRDILYSDGADTAWLTKVASTDVDTVTPDATAHDAFEKMPAGGFGHVPVVENDKVVACSPAPTWCAHASTNSTWNAANGEVGGATDLTRHPSRGPDNNRPSSR